MSPFRCCENSNRDTTEIFRAMTCDVICVSYSPHASTHARDDTHPSHRSRLRHAAFGAARGVGAGSRRRRRHAASGPGRRAERHGGGAGGARGAHRRRDPASRRQCGRRGGRGRLRDGGDVSARRQYRRRRLHGDPPRRRNRRGDRLSRDRAARRQRQDLPRCQRQRRSGEIARFGARGRRAGHGRGPGAGARKIRLGQIHAGATAGAGDCAGARRHSGRGRHCGLPAERSLAHRALAVIAQDISQA